MALDLQLGTRHGRAAGPQHLAAGGDRLGAKRQRGDTRRTVGPEDLAQAELLGDDQHGRIDLAVRAGDGRYDNGDLGNACHDGGGTDLHQHAGEGALAARHKESGTRDRRALLANHQARLDIEAPVTVLQRALVEAARVVDRMADGDLHGLGDLATRCCELRIGDPQLIGGNDTAIKPLQRAAHGGVAFSTDLRDQVDDRGLQRGIEDVVKPTREKRGAVLWREVGPDADGERTVHGRSLGATAPAWPQRRLLDGFDARWVWVPAMTRCTVGVVTIGAIAEFVGV